MRLAKAKVHFIGIGGIGMCGLAELLSNMGAIVTGSDANENLHTLRLKEMGIPIALEHDPANLGESEVVVFSSAVRETNVEYREARRRKIPLIRRAEALAEIMHLKRGVAVAGTHGKTTTTSLTASIFLEAELDPTIIIGGRLDRIQSTAQLGQGEWLVAEADESDGSFTSLSPEIVIITNVDNDHMDYYKTFANLKAVFLDFASRIPFYGVAIVCGDDPSIREMFSGFGKRWISYGTLPSSDYVLKRHGDHWRVMTEGHLVGALRPAMPGLHNALNSLAAVLTALEAGISFEVAARAIEKFGGVDRRFQHKASIRGIDFYDDYGHHPTEVRAVLNGFKEQYPKRRLVTVFQPHRFSRTQTCWSEFLECFNDTDVLYVLDIYPAGESPIEGISGATLAAEIKHPSCKYVARSALFDLVITNLNPGDILLTLGAGDISKIGEQLTDSFVKG